MNQFIEFFNHLEAPWNMIVLVMLITCFANVLKTIAKQSGVYASHRADLGFKRDLVERGLSVEEIERLIAAKSVNRSGSST
jgi:hypothetical protein